MNNVLVFLAKGIVNKIDYITLCKVYHYNN